MRRGYLAMKIDTGRKEKSSEWTFEGIREAAYEKVAKDEIGRFGIVQEILRKSTDFLRRIIAPSRWNGRSHFVVCLSTLQQFLPWRTTLGGFLQGTAMDTTESRSIATCFVRLVEATTNGERPTEDWWCRSV